MEKRKKGEKAGMVRLLFETPREAVLYLGYNTTFDATLSRPGRAQCIVATFF
jgi:hypothetical protein